MNDQSVGCIDIESEPQKQCNASYIQDIHHDINTRKAVQARPWRTAKNQSADTLKIKSNTAQGRQANRQRVSKAQPNENREQAIANDCIQQSNQKKT